MRNLKQHTLLSFLFFFLAINLFAQTKDSIIVVPGSGKDTDKIVKTPPPPKTPPPAKTIPPAKTTSPAKTTPPAKAPTTASGAVNFFYAEDFVIGGRHLIVKTGEIPVSGLLSYKIRIDAGTTGSEVSDFMLADIRPNQRTISSFIASFEKHLNKTEDSFSTFLTKDTYELAKLSTVLTKEADSLAIINDALMKDSDTLLQETIALVLAADTSSKTTARLSQIERPVLQSPILQPEERQAIIDMTEEASHYLDFNSRAFDNVFSKIRKALANNASDMEWLDKQIIVAKGMSQSNKRNFKAALENFAASYLMNAYLASIQPDEDAEATGKIYAKDSVQVSVFYPTQMKLLKKKDNIKRELEKELSKIHKKSLEQGQANEIIQGLTDPEIATIELRRFLVGASNFDYAELFNFGKGTFTKDILEQKLKDELKSDEATIDAMKNSLLPYLKILEVAIEFEFDQIKNIKVVGAYKIPRPSRTSKEIMDIFDLQPDDFMVDTVIFQNRVPISYSTKKDVSRDVFFNDKEVKLFTNRPFYGKSLYINFSDVFYNNFKLLNATENYSPVDGIIIVKPGETGKIIYKEKTVNILQAKVFSDFVGLNENQPNGLIQTEISKRVYLNSNIHQFGKRYAYRGWVNSIEPKVVLSKLEGNNRDLILDTFSMDNKIQHYVSTIDFYQHVNFSSGGAVNLFYLGLPKIHTMFYLNFGVSFNRASIAFPIPLDSLNNTAIQPESFNVNAVNLYPEFVFSIQPHPSYRFNYTLRWSPYYRIFSNDFRQLNTPEKFLTDGNDGNRQMISSEFTASIRPQRDKTGELFFRTFITFIPGDANLNFYQAQVGYSFNILSQKKQVPK